MIPQSGFLEGKKSYLMGGLAILGAVAGYAVGDLSLQEAMAAIWAGITTLTLRAGIAKGEKQPDSES